MLKVAGLVLAKRNSERLPGKNILPFHGKPMYMVNVLKCLDIFEKVYVSSDNDLMLAEATGQGAIGIKRGEELCGDTPNITVYKHAIEHMDADAFVAVQANSPTIDPATIRKAKDYLENGGTEVMTCHTESPDNTLYGSVWGMTKDRLSSYGDPYQPNPEFLIDDTSIDIHTMEDYKKALQNGK